MNGPLDPHEERRKLFRRMEVVYVWVPPLLALFVSGLGALLLAALVPLEGTTFWGRWVLAMTIILVIPTVVYVVKTFYLRK